MTQEQDGAIGDALTLLEAVVRARLAAGDAGASYVASLAAKGRGKIAQKLGEEATETVIAALTEDDAALTGEAGPRLSPDRPAGRARHRLGCRRRRTRPPPRHFGPRRKGRARAIAVSPKRYEPRSPHAHRRHPAL